MLVVTHEMGFARRAASRVDVAKYVIQELSGGQHVDIEWNCSEIEKGEAADQIRH